MSAQQSYPKDIQLIQPGCHGTAQRHGHCFPAAWRMDGSGGSAFYRMPEMSTGTNLKKEVSRVLSPALIVVRAPCGILLSITQRCSRAEYTCKYSTL